MQDSNTLLATMHGRQRLVDVILNITQGTAIEPQPYERMLLDQFVRGELTDDHVMILLEADKSF